MKVLIPEADHSYREATVKKIKVVYNQKYRTHTEYAGDEYLEDDEIVIEAQVAE